MSFEHWLKMSYNEPWSFRSSSNAKVPHLLIHWWLFLKDMFRWVDISINGKKAPLIKCKLITTSPMVTRNYKVVESFRNCGGNQTNQLQGNIMAKIK
jgi:hypothetical protein